MAYDRKQIFEEAKEVIQNKKLFFMEEVADFLPCARSTFYMFFPEDSPELEELKDLLFKNKSVIKQSLRNKWYQGDNSTTQLALYKLLASKDELRSLSMNNIEVGGDISIKWNEEKTYEKPSKTEVKQDLENEDTE